MLPLSPSRAPRFGITISLTLLVATLPLFSTVMPSQTPPPPCANLARDPRDHAWRQGATVTVNLNANNTLTQQQKDAIKCGLSAWENANGSGVTFQFTESATDVSGQLDKVQLNIQTPAEGFAEVGRYNGNTYGGPNGGVDYLISAYINLHPGVTHPDAICEKIAHEIGHTFGLTNCTQCSSTQSIMSPAPSATDPNAARAAGALKPTDCDKNISAEHYPSPTPLATPTVISETGEGCAEDCAAVYGPRWFCYEGVCNVMTPILLDTAGDGYRLTGAADGVRFALTEGGRPVQQAWTVADSDDAWLVLDRNDNNTVDGAFELFGNFTAQPPAPEKNGFLALAVLDGNADGVIDGADAVYPSLRLWRDANHDGVSESQELSTLASSDVTRIHLDFKVSKRTDEHGNEFRYRAKFDDARGIKMNRWAWDVILMPGR